MSMTASNDEADQEATAALLMLNTERRGTSSSSGSARNSVANLREMNSMAIGAGAEKGRGMSVKDLLSS